MKWKSLKPDDQAFARRDNPTLSESDFKECDWFFRKTQDKRALWRWAGTHPEDAPLQELKSRGFKNPRKTLRLIKRGLKESAAGQTAVLIELLPPDFEAAIKRICDRYYENTIAAAKEPKLRLSDLLRVELAHIIRFDRAMLKATSMDLKDMKNRFCKHHATPGAVAPGCPVCKLEELGKHLDISDSNGP